jgi:predicted acylesterase/phospholipase RssA
VNDERPTRRALILAGGGLKVAFQAGVLQVWLDETDDLEFHLADAASGGVFNLAMLCGGKSGTQIADAWRRTNPLSWFSLSPRVWRSISSLDRFRRNVLPLWDIDWSRVHRTELDATFNVYNFTKQRLETISPREMNADWMLAGVSLPMWFPPAVIGDDIYIDAVYSTDANLEYAVSRGANELWIIWTVSTEGRWRNGFVNQYFQTIEAAADGRLRESLSRIDEINRTRAPDDQITVRILRREVPLHYLFIFSADTLREAVEYGVQTAREWCRAEGITLASRTPAEPDNTTRLSFTETLKGYVGAGEEKPEPGADVGRDTGSELVARLTIRIDGVRHFLADPRHEAAISGTIEGGIVGGKRPIDEGTFNQFVYGDDPAFRKMLYRIAFRDGAGRRLTLEGEKHVPRRPKFRPWRDTTTLFARIVRHPDEGEPEVAAAGVIEITLPALLRQLTTFRARGQTRLGGVGLVLRYFAFFVGVCARVYLRGWPLRTRSEAPASERSQT